MSSIYADKFLVFIRKTEKCLFCPSFGGQMILIDVSTNLSNFFFSLSLSLRLNRLEEGI